MIKYTILAAIIWAAGNFLGAFDINSTFEMTTTFVSQFGYIALAYSTLMSFCLVGISYMLRALNFYGLMYVFSQLLLEISQFVIALLSVFAIFLWFDLHQNLWKNLGLVAVIPFELLAAACMCIHLFDFNIPLMSRFLRIIVFPTITGVVIFLSDIFGLLS